MNKWLELLLGLILIVVPIYVAWGFPNTHQLASWGVATMTVLKGGIIWFAIMIGLLFLMLGISDLKE